MKGRNLQTLNVGIPRILHCKNEGHMYFFVRTENPRPTFHLDMTTEERAIMERHVAYWSEKAARGLSN